MHKLNRESYPKDVGGSTSSTTSPSPLGTRFSSEVVFNHRQLFLANLLGQTISLQSDTVMRNDPDSQETFPFISSEHSKRYSLV